MRNPHKSAKALRKRATETEKRLWKYIRGKQLYGFKFRRQEPIGNYIVDFVCHEKSIVIELDGGQHGETKGLEKDRKRDAWLMSQGFKVLRFWDNEVFENIEGVIEMIIRNCDTTPSPNPSHEVEGN